jgi:hypothetical protein
MDDKPKLLDLIRNTIRLKHYSIRTERAYIDWVKRFILFHHKRHPASMGAPALPNKGGFDLISWASMDSAQK